MGGVPPNYVIKRGMTGTNTSFAGCITDATRNGNVVNFANYTDKIADILGKCVLEETIGSETEVHIGIAFHINKLSESLIYLFSVPTLPPIQEVGFGKTKAPPPTTEDPYLAGKIC